MKMNFLSEIRLRKAHISDGSALVRGGVLTGSVKDAENLIRSDISNPDCRLYIQDGFLGRIVMNRDTNFSAELYIKHNSLITDNRLTDYINQMCAISFFKYDIHKVSIKVRADEDMLDRAVMEAGFVQIALLLDEYRDGDVYADAALYSMKRPEFRLYNTCFVPFQRGIASVSGTADYIDKVTFLNYGDIITDEMISQAAWNIGITDDDGRLLPRGSKAYDIDIRELNFLPPEVRRAGLELREFFLKKRDSFDINISLEGYTEFQVSVWETLKTIPYGTTCSYEDVALQLTGGDIARARKITRAVGNACSENPVPILIPCHRVIGKNGMLVGFSGGIQYKDFLLQNEMFSSALPLN